MNDDTHYPRYCEPPAKRPTPETNAFFRTFLDGQAAPSHAEYYDRMAQLERERDKAREQRDRLAEALRMLRNASLKHKMDKDDLEIEDANEALAAVEVKPNETSPSVGEK